MADREFIAAKDLPVTEVEEVNVLVVDPATGELAQKAGVNLGGSGEYDVVVSCMYGAVAGTSGYIYYDPVLVSGDFSALSAKIESGKAINGVALFTDTSDYDAPYVSPIISAGFTNDDYYVDLYCYFAGNGTLKFRLEHDGTIVVS